MMDLCETNLQTQLTLAICLNDSLPLIQKDSVNRMYGFLCNHIAAQSSNILQTINFILAVGNGSTGQSQ